MPSKSATTSASKASKAPKSKPPKSSEYINDSDLDNDEPMTDAPAKKASSKPAEKTSKKRNRDGSEKTNGASTVSTVSKKDSATSKPKNKASNGTKKTKKAEVVDVSSAEESEPEPQTSPDDRSSEEEEDESSSSGSESESEDEDDTEPAKVTKSTTTQKSFSLPIESDVPSGFTTMEATASGSIPSSLDGKQIFVFTAPKRLNFSELKKIKLNSGLDGETIQAGDVNFTIRRAQDVVASGMKVLLPKEAKKGYKLASIKPSAQFAITEAAPVARKPKGSESREAPGPRAQPEGLRMRFMPAGYGEESDIHVNKAVLPRMDLVVGESDGDVTMQDLEIASAPKSSKKGEGQVVEPPTPKEKKKKRPKAPEGGILADKEEENPENIEAVSKKEKKKDKEGRGSSEKKKEKKNKHKDEDGKKEKKKHKKDKAEA